MTPYKDGNKQKQILTCYLSLAIQKNINYGSNDLVIQNENFFKFYK